MTDFLAPFLAWAKAVGAAAQAGPWFTLFGYAIDGVLFFAGVVVCFAIIVALFFGVHLWQWRKKDVPDIDIGEEL